MATKLRMILDTHRLNFRFSQWPITVLDPFEDIDAIVQTFHQQKAVIDADRHLTRAGKVAANVKAAKEALKKISDLQAPRLAGLDADLGAHRTALLPASTEQPDARRIDFLLSHLRDKTPQQIATFYGSASPEEQQLMEQAAAAVGRIPMVTANGQEWQPLLNPETVNESLIARATAKNPDGAKKLAELTEIKQMHQTVAGIAAAEVRQALGDYRLEPDDIAIYTSDNG